MSNSISSTGSSAASSLQDSSTLSSYKKIQLDMQSLGTALQSGDLASAKTAFSTLQQDAPNLAAQSQNRQSTNPRAQAMGLLGRALQAGNVPLAQQSLSALQQTMTGANQGDASSSDPGASSDATPTLLSLLNDSSTPTSQNPSLLDYLDADATSDPSTQEASLLDSLGTDATDNSLTQIPSLLNYSDTGVLGNLSNGTSTSGSILNTLA
ncbi:MAG TPA: hypothetical protein VGM64_13325 [Lacunisphaera sp.]